MIREPPLAQNPAVTGRDLQGNDRNHPATNTRMMQYTHSSGKSATPSKKNSADPPATEYPDWYHIPPVTAEQEREGSDNLLKGWDARRHTRQKSRIPKAYGGRVLEDAEREWIRMSWKGSAATIASLVRWLAECCSQDKRSYELSVGLYLIPGLEWNPERKDFLKCGQITRGEIAEGLGVSEVTVSKCISRLRQRGIIQVQYRSGRVGSTNVGGKRMEIRFLYAGTFTWRRFTIPECRALSDRWKGEGDPSILAGLRCWDIVQALHRITGIPVPEWNGENPRGKRIRVEIPSSWNQSADRSQKIDNIRVLLQDLRFDEGDYRAFPYDEFPWVKPLILLFPDIVYHGLYGLNSDIPEGACLWMGKVVKILKMCKADLDKFKELTPAQQRHYVERIRVNDMTKLEYQERERERDRAQSKFSQPLNKKQWQSRQVQERPGGMTSIADLMPRALDELGIN